MKLDRFARIGTLLSVAAFGAFWLLDPTFSEDPTVQLLGKSLVSRVLGTAVFLFVLLYLGFRVYHKPVRGWWKAFLPSLLIAVNNAPILALITKQAWVERTDLLWLYILDTLFIGVFEELAFRGVLFPAVLEKFGRTRKGILFTTVISSAAFGLIHLANLAEGAGVGATVLQVGYSFLIGGMCAIVLLKSGNVFLCMLLHFVYDFGGKLIDTIGGGKLWDTPTVVMTVVFSVLVTAWMLYLLVKVEPADAERFFPPKKEKTDAVADEPPTNFSSD